MKMALRFAAAFLALAALLGTLRAAEDDEKKEEKTEHKDYRIFTAKNGKTIEARVVTRIDDENYTVEDKEGKSYKLNLNNLSASDQQFLEFWEPGAILDFTTATLPEVLKKMKYSMADLTVSGDTQIFTAEVDGEEMKFVLAPGRNFSTLDPSAAETLGLQLSEGTLNIQDGQGNQERTKQGTVKAFVIGDVEIESVDFQVFDLAKIAGTVPANTAGAVGTDLLTKLNALVDLGGQRLFVKKDD
jgi:hypothetical protein